MLFKKSFEVISTLNTLKSQIKIAVFFKILTLNQIKMI